MAAPNARPPLASRAAVATEVERIRARGQHIAPVTWLGQDAWLKLATPQPPAWRYHLLAGMAKLLGQPAMQPVRPYGGSHGLRIESARIRALAASGLRTPILHEFGEDWLLLSDLGQITLEHRLGRADPDERLALWQHGADYILRAHRSGQYLSQAFARNFVWSDDDGLGAIDFEDDALGVMSLADAQVRDWLPYCFSTAIHFSERLPELCAALEAALAAERPVVRAGVLHALRQTAWLRALRVLPAPLMRRDVAKTRWFGELARRCTAR